MTRLAVEEWYGGAVGARYRRGLKKERRTHKTILTLVAMFAILLASDLR
jgi:hypothetical protein